MNIIRKTYTALVILVLAVGATGCSIDGINENPNNPVDENMQPDKLLPLAQLNTAKVLSSYTLRGYNPAGNTYNMWLGYWARSGKYGSNADQEAYLITSTFAQENWENSYDILYNLTRVEQKAVEAEAKGFQGISLVLQCIHYSMLVDSYDEIIYTEAFKDGVLAPKYDKGADVYKALFEKLNTADELFKTADAGSELNLKASDAIFNGDMSKWRKFGNTVHLRLALRLVNVDQATAKAEIDKIVANGAGFLGSGESAEVHLGFKKDNDRQNPFWNHFYRGVDGKLKDDFFRANAYIVGLLESTKDPRLGYFFREINDEEGAGYLGIPFGEQDQEEKDKHMPNMTSMVSGPGLAKGIDAPIWILPSFESLFLQAEAIQRGLLAGNAEQAYRAAVKESFLWLEVGRFEKVLAREGEVGGWQETLDGVVTDFIDRTANWDRATDKLKLIMQQKYIAMTGINGAEAFADYRRTGIPDDLPKSLHRQLAGKHIPYRLVYPTSETTSNKVNMPKGKDPQKDKIFWMN